MFAPQCFSQTRGLGAIPDPPRSHTGYLMADGNLVEAHAELVGTRTCNEAEYEALIVGLHACARLKIAVLRVVSDSQLMVRQFNGENRVKSRALAPRFEEARHLLRKEFAYARVEHRLRDDTQLSACDQMVNGVLDAAGFPKKPPHFPRRRAVRSR